MGKTFREICRLNSTDIAIDKDTLWFTRPSLNGLIELNLNTKKADIIYSFPEYKEYNWFQSLCRVGKHIIMFPSGLDRIVLFDTELKTDVVFELDIPKSGQIKYDRTLTFWDYCVFDECVYIAGYTYPAILRIEPDEKRMTVIDDWIKMLDGHIEERAYNGYFGLGFCRTSNIIWFPMLCCNAIFELDADTQKSRLIFVNDVKSGFRTMSKDTSDSTLWLETVEGEIVHIDNEFRIISRYKIPEKMSSYYWGEFWPPVIKENKVFLYPMTALRCYVIDKKENNMHTYSEDDPFFDKKGLLNLQMVKEVDDRVFLISYDDYLWRVIEDIDNSGDDCCYHLPEEIMKKEVLECCRDKGIMHEDVDGLKLFIGALK